MRKFSKFLAVVLCFAAITGMFTVFASASITTDQLKPANAVNTVAADFESSSVGETKYKSYNGSSELVYGTVYANNFGNLATVAVKQQSNKEETETNKYLSIDRMPLASVGSGPYWEFNVGDYKSKKNCDGTYTFADYDYFIVEFDLACNEYSYKIDGVTYSGTTVPEGATDVTLNYPEVSFNYILRTTGGFNWVQIYLRTDGKDWYLSSDSTCSPDTDIKLSSECGVWNHLSFFVVGDRVDPKNITQHIYVNGQYLKSQTILGSSHTSTYAIANDSFRMDVPPAVATDAYKDFNVSLDNISAYAYAKDYSSGDKYGIDDFFSDDGYKTNSIVNCTDIVYNENYTYVGTPNPPTITIEKLNGSKVGYFMPGLSAINSIEDGDYVTTSYSILNYTPKEGVETLTFKCNESASITLSNEAKVKYQIVKYKDTYKVRSIDSLDTIDIKWISSSAPDGVIQKLPALTLPSQISGELTDWHWDLTGSGVYTEIKQLTVAELFELKEINNLSVIEIRLKSEPVACSSTSQSDSITPSLLNDSISIDETESSFVRIGTPRVKLINVEYKCVY